MVTCESCRSPIRALDRNLFGRTRLCRVCRHASFKPTPATEAADNQPPRLVESLASAGPGRRVWVGLTRGGLHGVLIPLTIALAASAGGPGDASLVPKGSRWLTAIAAGLIVAAGAAGWWVSGGWLAGALSAWAVAVVVGAAFGARAGLRGEWGWLS